MTCRMYFLTFFVGMLFFSSCQNEGKQPKEETQQEEFVSTEGETSNPVEPQPQLPPPVNSDLKEKLVEEQTDKSPFKGLGCCEDNSKRITEDCCCNEVLSLYKKMFESKSKDLGKLRKTDPILGDCRNKLKKEFYNIDYPPESEDDDSGI